MVRNGSRLLPWVLEHLLSLRPVSSCRLVFLFPRGLVRVRLRALFFVPLAGLSLVALVLKKGILHLVYFLLDALVKGALHVIHGALELGDPFAQRLGQVGEFLGPDEDEGHNQDDDEFLHADAEHDRHLETCVIKNPHTGA